MKPAATATLGIVDSLGAWRALAREQPDVRIATDNPLLAFDPRVGNPLWNIDGLIVQAEAAQLGSLALELTDRIERSLAQPAVTAAFGLPAGPVGVTGVVSRLVASLVHRSAALARALQHARPGRAVLRLAEAPRWEPQQPFILPRFAHPAAVLAREGYFGEITVDLQFVSAALPAGVNETGIRSWIRRLAMLPASQIAFEIADRLRLTRIGGPQVLVGPENEAIRESLLWLWLSGYRIERGRIPPRNRAQSAVAVADEAAIHPLIARTLDGELEAAFSASGFFTAPQAAALARVIQQHLTQGLSHLANHLPALREWAARAAESGRLYLTNGHNNPASAAVYRLLADHGADVVEFEHGVTAGISSLTDRKRARTGAPPVRCMLVCAAGAAQVFNDVIDCSAAPIGLPDQVRRLYRPGLQRRLARRRLGVGLSDRVTMHVSTLPYMGNHRPGLAAPTETTIYELDRRLIEEVYPRLGHTVVFKQYPTQRFPHEPAYGELFKPSPAVRVLYGEDFRYIRAAADTIVTMTPTSTLGWCVGAGVPIVWLDSTVMNPLSNTSLRAAFRAAFLFVDLDKGDWAELLMRILARPLSELRTEWSARSGAREKLYRDHITGPAGSAGRSAARCVLGDFRKREAVIVN